MTENKGYLQRYAMLFGTYLGGYWILKFILFPMGLDNSFLLFLFIGLTLCVPFMGYYYTRVYRDKICNGSISFAHAWTFTVFMYLFAALLTSVAHYLYFRFIDHGFVIDTYENMMNTLMQAPMPGMDAYMDQLKEAITLLRALSPVDITIQLISQNVIYGTLLAIPTALFVMKRKQPVDAEQK